MIEKVADLFKDCSFAVGRIEQYSIDPPLDRVEFWTETGRPVWSKVLPEYLQQYSTDFRKSCGVLACGSRPMCRAVHHVVRDGITLDGAKYSPTYLSEKFY